AARRAGARRRRERPPGRGGTRALGAAPAQQRLDLDGLQACVRARRARGGTRPREDPPRRPVVRRRARVTRRNSSSGPIASLQRANRSCRACVDAGYTLESRAVVLPYTGQRAYVFGQAPGVQEGLERLPWRGRAGRTLRRWLEMDEDTFYGTFYCASV